MSTILHQGPAPAQPGTPEATALRKLGDWREKERIHEADKRSRDKQRAEYQARRKLSEAADNLKGSGQP